MWTIGNLIGIFGFTPLPVSPVPLPTVSAHNPYYLAVTVYLLTSPLLSDASPPQPTPASRAD